MDTVILEVADAKTSRERFIRAWESGKSAKEVHISFESFDLMWKVLNANRCALLRAMCGAGAIGLRELARRVQRDVKSVYTDTRILLNAGVIDRTDDGKLLFPYRYVKIHAEFDGTHALAA